MIIPGWLGHSKSSYVVSLAKKLVDSKFEVAGSQVDIEMTSSFTGYTWGVLGFEVVVSVLALIALLNRPR